MSESTIAAIATALGESSVGMIRISGKDAIAIADRVFFAFSGEPLSARNGYTAAYGEIKDGETILDDAVALVFREPKSYTGENVVELTLHGGTLLLRKTLRLLLQNGAVMAAPGEFTKRAFLNGKTDLTKAESIMGLISAKSEAELRLSTAAHLGKVGEKLEKIEQILLGLDAAVSVFSDYPDEELEGVSEERFATDLTLAKTELETLLSTYDAGRVIREGIDAVIVGKPNVGKSTLMNLLSGTERSIVTEIAGTTRDVVEDTVNIGGILLRLADTAGIHETKDAVETIGVSRAKERLSSAGLVLAVFDGSEPFTHDDEELLSRLDPAVTVAVINKNDLTDRIDLSPFSGYKTVGISAATGKGYEALCDAVKEISGAADLDPDSAILINERQRSLAQKALCSVTEAQSALLAGQTLDAVGVCVDDAIAALLELTGKRVTNLVTEEIFKRFCVGK